MATKRKYKNTFLSFNLGNEIFAVSVNNVLEVLQKKTITEVPESLDYVLGVLNFRGEMIPVAETRKKFKLPEREENTEYVIIVFDLLINDKKTVIAAIADGVSDVISIDDDEKMEIPDTGIKYNARYLSGMIKSGEKFIMILDIDKVFTEDDVKILNEVTEKSKVPV